MVILSGSNIGSTQPHSLPSPARGSPPGISPNKGNSAVLPELTGLERMLQGWRRQAEKKAQQIRQRDLESEAKRQKEQQEVNDIRLKIIETRMKKIEQQQQSSAKNAKNNASMTETGLELSRKRRYDDDYYSTTPNDSGFSCTSPETYGIESGYCAPAKSVKVSATADKPSPQEKNASVFIETYQLPPMPPPPSIQMAPKRSSMGRSAAHAPTYPVGDSKMAFPHHGAGYNFNATSSVAPTMPAACSHIQRPSDEQASGSSHGQMGDVALPKDFEEELIRSLPVDLNAALTPDFMRAIDALEQASSATTRALTTQANAASASPSCANVRPTLQYSAPRSNVQQQVYPTQQQYANTMTLQTESSPQNYYNLLNRTSALGAWHQPAQVGAAQPQYPNPYATNGQHAQSQQQVMNWPNQNSTVGNASCGFLPQF